MLAELIFLLAIGHPPPPAPASLVDPPRSDRELIRRVISKSVGRFADCAMKSEQRTGVLPNKIIVVFTIRPGGHVVHPEVALASKDPEYDACILRRFEKMRFPNLETKRSIAVRYPVLLCFAG